MKVSSTECSQPRTVLDERSLSEVVRFFEDHGFKVGTVMPGENGDAVILVVVPWLGCYLEGRA